MTRQIEEDEKNDQAMHRMEEIENDQAKYRAEEDLKKTLGRIEEIERK